MPPFRPASSVDLLGPRNASAPSICGVFTSDRQPAADMRNRAETVSPVEVLDQPAILVVVEAGLVHPGFEFDVAAQVESGRRRG